MPGDVTLISALCKKEEFGKYKDFSNKIINSLKIHPLK
jgi:hypothetical protein